jgi:hypothetical protein
VAHLLLEPPTDPWPSRRGAAAPQPPAHRVGADRPTATGSELGDPGYVRLALFGPNRAAALRDTNDTNSMTGDISSIQWECIVAKLQYAFSLPVRLS